MNLPDIPAWSVLGLTVGVWQCLAALYVERSQVLSQEFSP